MSTAKQVLAVCVNWNGRAVLPDTLESLKRIRYPQLSVVVVDCASEDGSFELVPDSMQRVRLGRNAGYAAALNSVLGPFFGSIDSPYQPPKGYQPEYFLLLNNDVILAPDLIEKMVRFAERQGPAIYGPKVLLQGDPNRLEAAWGDLTWSHVLAHYRGKGAPDGSAWNQTRRVLLLLGCSLLVHREVIRKVGLFDENFFLYHEEVDFLLRAARAGFPAYYCPFTQVYHRSAWGTRKRPLAKVYWLRRNTVYFFRKHGAGQVKWGFFAVTLCLSLLYNVLLLRWKRTAVICRGVIDGFKVPKFQSSQVRKSED